MSQNFELAEIYDDTDAQPYRLGDEAVQLKAQTQDAVRRSAPHEAIHFMVARNEYNSFFIERKPTHRYHAR